MIVRDVPLLVVRGYSLGGLPEPMSDHIDYYRAHGITRSRPLAPSVTGGLMAEFLAQWRAACGDSYIADVMATVDTQFARVRDA